jgi:hypothetical protein
MFVGQVPRTMSEQELILLFQVNMINGRLLAKKGDGWLSLVARLLATAALMGSNPDISQKYKMADISQGVANTL